LLFVIDYVHAKKNTAYFTYESPTQTPDTTVTLTHVKHDTNTPWTL